MYFVCQDIRYFPDKHQQSFLDEFDGKNNFQISCQSSRILQNFKMLSFKALDIYDVFKPLHYCSQLIGLTSFSIKYENGVYREVVKVYNIFLLLFTTVWNLSAFVLLLIDTKEMWHVKLLKVSDIFEKSMFCVVLTFLLVSTLTNWWIFLSRKEVTKLFNNIIKVDRKLEELKVPVDLTKQKRFILCLVISAKFLIYLGVVIADVVGRSANTHETSLFMTITMCISIQMWIFVICQFVFLMYSVKVRFEKVNEFLAKKFLEASEESLPKGNNELKIASVLYEKLVDICETINRCYGLPVSEKMT